jgi:cell division protein FtsB
MSEVQRLNQIVQKLNQDNQKLNQDNQKLVTINQTLKANISTLDRENRSHVAEISRLHSENNRLSQQASRSVCQKCTMRC